MYLLFSCSEIHITSHTRSQTDKSKESPSSLPLVTSVPTPSGCLFVWMALEFVEFNTVQLFKPLLTELAGVVVVGLWSVFLHVPVEGGTLATLIATDFTSNRRCEWDRKRKKVMVTIMLFSLFFILLCPGSFEFFYISVMNWIQVHWQFTSFNRVKCSNMLDATESFSAFTYWSGVSPVWVRLWTSRWFLRLNDFPHVSHMKSLTPVKKTDLDLGVYDDKIHK